MAKKTKKKKERGQLRNKTNNCANNSTKYDVEVENCELKPLSFSDDGESKVSTEGGNIHDIIELHNPSLVSYEESKVSALLSAAAAGASIEVNLT